MVKKKYLGRRKRSLTASINNECNKLENDCLFSEGNFQNEKGFDQQTCQVQITQTATDYSRSVFVKRGSETVSKALVNCMPGNTKYHMLC